LKEAGIWFRTAGKDPLYPVDRLLRAAVSLEPHRHVYLPSRKQLSRSNLKEIFLRYLQIQMMLGKPVNSRIANRASVVKELCGDLKLQMLLLLLSWEQRVPRMARLHSLLLFFPKAMTHPLATN
jgi:hypothetical protein